MGVPINSRFVLFILCFGFFLLLPQASQAATLLKPTNNLGLVGYWNFNEGTSTQATDFSGNRNHGTLNTFSNPATGASGWTQQGRVGGALRFDGSSDDVTVGDMSNVTDGIQRMTISAWIKADTLGDYANIVTKFNGTNGWAFQASGAGAGGSDDFSFYPDIGGSGDAVYTTSNSHATGVWEHWVVTFDGTVVDDLDSVDFYKNGVEITSESQTAAIGTVTDSNATSVSIGGDTTIGGPDGEFDGIIDEVRIYTRVLSPTEIRGLYGAGGGAVRVGASTKTLSETSTLNTGLVGHWTFDGVDFTSFIRDVSSNSNNAYVFGVSTSSVKTRGKFGQAVNFVESAYYLYAPDNASLNFGSSQDFSASLWIKARGIDGAYAGLVGDKLSRATNRLGYLLSYENGGGVGVYISDGVDEASVFSTTLVSDGEWHHVAVTASRTGNATLYVDGVSEGTPASLAVVGSLDEPSSPVFIGDIGFQGQPFDGVIDDVRIYNRALSAKEVRELSRLGNVRAQ